MSVGFSTIRPMDPATISRAPSYSSQNNAPAASSPMDTGSAPKKKSHWFLKTLAAIAVVTAAVGLGRKYLPAVFDSSLNIAADAKWHEKALGYAKKYIGVAGDYVNTYASKAVNYVKQGWESIVNKIKNDSSIIPPNPPAS